VGRASSSKSLPPEFPFPFKKRPCIDTSPVRGRKGKATKNKSVAGTNGGRAIRALRLTCCFEIRPFAGVESRRQLALRGEAFIGKHNATTSIHVNGEKWLCHNDLKV
jgi:hypothetical protein